MNIFHANIHRLFRAITVWSVQGGGVLIRHLVGPIQMFTSKKIDNTSFDSVSHQQKVAMFPASVKRCRIADIRRGWP